jgi:hypothetical protein
MSPGNRRNYRKGRQGTGSYQAGQGENKKFLCLEMLEKDD